MRFNIRHLVTIDKDTLSFTDIDTGAVQYSGECRVVVDEQTDRIVQIGNEPPGSPSGIVVRPLSSERILISHFSALEAVLQHSAKKNQPNSLFLLKPIGYVQVLRNFPDGISEVENRALLEAFRNAGFRTVVVRKQGKFTEQELRTPISKLDRRDFMIMGA